MNRFSLVGMVCACFHALIGAQQGSVFLRNTLHEPISYESSFVMEIDGGSMGGITGKGTIAAQATQKLTSGTKINGVEAWNSPLRITLKRQGNPAETVQVTGNVIGTYDVMLFNGHFVIVKTQEEQEKELAAQVENHPAPPGGLRIKGDEESEAEQKQSYIQREPRRISGR